MSQAPRPNTDALTTPQYGIREFDLSTDRHAEEDFELVRANQTRSVTVLDVPAECYLRLGGRQSPRLDLRDFENSVIEVPNPDEQTLGALYIENPTGVTGTLRLFLGAEVRAPPELSISTIETIEDIQNTVTVDDDGTFEVNEYSGSTVPVEQQTPNAIEDTGGTQIDPATLQSIQAEQTRAGNTLAGIANGQDTTAASGTAEALNGGTSLTIPDGASLSVKALSGNGGSVYVGDSNVTTSNGYELSAGESVSLDVGDVSTVFVDVDTGGEGVSWIVEQ